MKHIYSLLFFIVLSTHGFAANYQVYKDSGGDEDEAIFRMSAFFQQPDNFDASGIVCRIYDDTPPFRVVAAIGWFDEDNSQVRLFRTDIDEPIAGSAIRARYYLSNSNPADLFFALHRKIYIFNFICSQEREAHNTKNRKI